MGERINMRQRIWDDTTPSGEVDTFWLPDLPAHRQRPSTRHGTRGFPTFGTPGAVAGRRPPWGNAWLPVDLPWRTPECFTIDDWYRHSDHDKVHVYAVVCARQI
jgi:hypothetical protein